MLLRWKRYNLKVGKYTVGCTSFITAAKNYKVQKVNQYMGSGMVKKKSDESVFEYDIPALEKEIVEISINDESLETNEHTDTRDSPNQSPWYLSHD